MSELGATQPVARLAARLGINTTSESYQRMRAEARARHAREIQIRCAFGMCVILYDPVDKKIGGGFGPSGCPHEYLPGGNSRHPAGLPKPRFAVKATGRHKSRIERSVRRHRGIGKSGIMRWMEEIYEENR